MCKSDVRSPIVTVDLNGLCPVLTRLCTVRTCPRLMIIYKSYFRVFRWRLLIDEQIASTS